MTQEVNSAYEFSLNDVYGCPVCKAPMRATVIIPEAEEKGCIQFDCPCCRFSDFQRLSLPGMPYDGRIIYMELTVHTLARDYHRGNILIH